MGPWLKTATVWKVKKTSLQGCVLLFAYLVAPEVVQGKQRNTNSSYLYTGKEVQDNEKEGNRCVVDNYGEVSLVFKETAIALFTFHS